MKKKIILIIVAVVLVLGAIGGGIYFYYFKNASADVSTVNQLYPAMRAKAQEILNMQHLKYPDGSCLPRYRFHIFASNTDPSGKKIYVKIIINRQKSNKCYLSQSDCLVDFLATEYEESYYQFTSKKGLTSIGNLNGGQWKESIDMGDNMTTSYKLPFACCQVGPTTPPPSPTATTTYTPTTTPSSPTPTPSYSWTPTPSY